jgi:hypothetical protein
LEEISEIGGDVPGFGSLVKHEGEDGREGEAVGFVVSGVDFGHVGKQAEWHGRVRFALVLEEEVEEGLAVSDVDGKEEVRVDLLEAGFYERGGGE